MYLYRATGDPYLLEVGEDIMKSIQYSAKTACGYATIKNVKDHRKQDTMESFFLAETTKYLYLLFDPDNFLNSDGGYGTVIETQNGECIIESSYIFNTEAHPIDVGALKCCYDLPRESLVKGFNRKKFLGESTSSFDRSAPETYDDDLVKPIEEVDATQSTEDFKKVLVTEIMSALSNAKKKIEENVELQKRFVEITNRERDGSFDLEKNVVDLGKSPKKLVDTSDNMESSTQQETETEDEKESIEIVKLPSIALDSDNVSLKQTSTDIDDDFKSLDDSENLTTSTDDKKEMRVVSKPVDSNNSMLSEFVQAILKSATRKPKKFDPQQLLERIRENQLPRNDSWMQKYEILTCKAQPYLQRISVMGEFY